MKKGLEVTEIWFCQPMLRISWKEHMNNVEVLRKLGTKMTLMLTIRKRHGNSGTHNEGFEN